MESKTGFEAMGLPVTDKRMINGYNTVKEMIPNISNEKAFSIVGKCAELIKRDECFGIVGAVTSLDENLKIIDLTGRYRLLSVMLHD